MAQIKCYSCQHRVDFDPPLSRREECPKCRRDLKVCLNCCFYDPQAHHECRETEAEWVKEKDCSNFCAYFSPSEEGNSETQTEKMKIQNRLDDLFKK